MVMAGENGRVEAVIWGREMVGFGWFFGLFLVEKLLFREWCFLLVFCLIIYIYSMVYIGWYWFVQWVG